MRRAALSAAGLALLAGPTALSFFAGGYFEEPALWAGLGAWLVVLVAAVAAPGGLPRRRGGRVAIGGLVFLAAWTLLSTTWAPVRGTAYQAGQQVVLYAGVLIGAVLVLRGSTPHTPIRAVEPALAAGALVVIGYGLSERLLPGLLHFARSVSAEGRLEQPLTYWNAMGEVAAIGFVLTARLAGDVTRSRALRAGAAAAGVPLGLGLYLTVSRGALFACAAGLVVLIVAAPRVEQLRAIGIQIVTAAVASAVGAQLGGVATMSGPLSTRETDGAVMFAVLVALALVAGAAQTVGRERPRALPLPRRAPWLALAILVAGLALAIVVGNQESSREAQPLSSGTSRLVTLRSNRYAYWRVALRAFADEPVRGVGAGGWAVYWLRDRTVSEGAQDAHSLPLQTAAELGLVGLAALGAFVGGTAAAAGEAHRVAAGAAAGPMAGLATYAAHAPLDWDWQMPAVTLIAMVLAGAVIALAEGGR